MTLTETPPTTTPAPTWRLTGACACCGSPTGSLFAMGHDARFRGVLARALAAQGWSAELAWFTSAASSLTVSVTQALEGVSSLIGRDWVEKVEKSASRLVRTPVSQGGARPSVRPSEASSGPALRDFSTERIDALLDSLDGRPLTGQWGWWRPAWGTPAGKPRRFPARVQATRRDKEQDSRIDLFCPTALEAGITTALIVERVDPREWLRDEEARSA